MKNPLYWWALPERNTEERIVQADALRAKAHAMVERLNRVIDQVEAAVESLGDDHD